MHANEGKGAGLVGVGQLELVSFDEVLMNPVVTRDLGVPFKELRRGMDERAADVVPPVTRA